MIVGLFPELTSPGGVQRAGRLTAAAMAAFAERHGEQVLFLSLNDASEASPFSVGLQQIQFSGFHYSKARFLRAAWKAARCQPTLIFALHPNLAPVVAVMKLAAPSARTAIFAHGIEVWSPLPWLRRKCLQRADLAFAPSSHTARELAAQQGLPSEKIHRLPWSLGPEFSGTLNAASGPPPDGFPSGRIILTVGRWDAREAYKGVDHLILALPKLLESVPDVHLVAVGSGTDLPRLEALAQESGVPHRVHFLSGISNDQLAAAYSASDIFALPSRGEGFGLVFLEAMSHGKPVIGGTHGGTPDVIADGADGYLIEYGKVDQLEDRLRHLLNNEEARRHMGARALERVCRDFTFGRFCENLESLLSPHVTPQPVPCCHKETSLEGHAGLPRP
jgi:glycosyltransferase involved in cell wall biosynthesis